jgi:hypothetical protein
VAVGPDGDPVVAGIVRNTDGTASLLTIKYDRLTGGPLWADEAPGMVNDQSGDGWVAVDDAGDVLTCCKVWGGATSYDLRLAKLDGIDGSGHWERTWTNGTAADDPTDLLLVDGFDPVVVGVTGGDFLTVRLDGTIGEELWYATYAGPRAWYDVANRVIRAGDELLVTGFSDGFGTSWDVATVSYDAGTGQENWSVRFDGPDHLTDEPADLMVVDGALFVTGYSYGAVSGQDLFMLAYDLNPATAAGDGPSVPPALGAFPNPFNPTTRFTLELPEAGEVRLTIHDLAGRLVAELVRGEAAACPRVVAWHGVDAAGRSVPSGVYAARLRTAAGMRAMRVVLVR